MRSALRVAAAVLAVVILAGSAATLAPAAARAETETDYGIKLTLLLDWLRRSMMWADMNRRSEALCAMGHEIAEEHVRIASRMTPPTAWRLVHPHLVLVAENTERAFDACSRAEITRFRVHIAQARTELRTLEGILVHLRIRLRQIPR